MRIWRILTLPAFARYWTGDTAVRLVDELTAVAILWYLAAYGHSARELGWYAFWTAAPVLAGGPLMATLFRRFPVRTIMVGDFAIRSLRYGVLAVALAAARPGTVHWIWFDMAAAAQALVFMATAAGGPALWPQVVPGPLLKHAMQAEQIGWNIAAVLGPLAAGLVMQRLGLWIILATASALLALAAWNLAQVSLNAGTRTPVAPLRTSRRVTAREVSRIMRAHPPLWQSTALFWSLNFVQGFLWVLWPLLAHAFWNSPGMLYTALLTTQAVGTLSGSVLLPTVVRRPILLQRILLTESLAGMAMILVLLGLRHPQWAFIAVFVSACLGGSSPFWAMQIRFHATTTEERPVVMTYIRTALQTAGPLGGLLAGFAWHSQRAGILVSGAALTLTLPPLIGAMLAVRRPLAPPPAADRF